MIQSRCDSQDSSTSTNNYLNYLNYLKNATGKSKRGPVNSRLSLWLQLEETEAGVAVVGRGRAGSESWVGQQSIISPVGKT